MKKFWKAFGMAMAYVAAFVGIQAWVSSTAVFFLMADLVETMGTQIFEEPDLFLEFYMGDLTRELSAMILVSNLLTIGGLWLFFALRRMRFTREIRLVKTSWKNVLLAIPFGIGMSFTVDLLTSLLPIPQTIMEDFAAQHSLVMEGNLLITFLSVAIVGPISEEICFRGLCYGRLRSGMRPMWAGLISAVCFGIVHGNPVWFLVGLLAGLALGWIYEITGSLWAPILVHITNNTIAQLTSSFQLPQYVYGILAVAGLILFPISIILLWRTNRRAPLQQPPAAA